jgi:hypothetical protein
MFMPRSRPLAFGVSVCRIGLELMWRMPRAER